MANRRLLLAFAALTLISLVPIWGVAWPALTDMGVHLAAASVWHNYTNPQFDYETYYALSLGPNPYWAHYLLLRGFAFVAGMVFANKLVLSLYVMALPAGMALLARRFDRSPWLGLFGFPIVWNFNFHFGFLNFCLGLAAVPFALCAFDAFCEKPTARRAAPAVLAGLVMPFFHLLPWGMYLAAAGLMGLLHEGRTIRRLALRAAVWSPSVILGLLILGGGHGYAMGNLGHVALKFYPVRMYLREFWDYFLNSSTGWVDEALGLLLLSAFIALKVTAPRERLRWHTLRAEACALVALTAYLVLPRSVLSPIYWWGINIRYATFFGVFAALCIQGPIDLTRGWRRWLLVPVAACGVGFAAHELYHYRRAAEFARGYEELAALPEPKTRVLVIVWPPWRHPEWRFDYTRNYYSFFEATHGSYMPWHFDHAFPLVYKQRFPAPDWSRPAFRWEQHARYYDYVLTHQAPANLMRGHEHEAIRMGDAGRWTLWKLPGPRVDTPPGSPYPGNWAYDPRWVPPP